MRFEKAGSGKSPARSLNNPPTAEAGEIPASFFEEIFDFVVKAGGGIKCYLLLYQM
jgi:hypothetical protein